MLITKTFYDVPSKLSPNGSPNRVFIIAPTIPGYPKAKFPGVVVFSEIYQVTGPVERFAGQIASQGYVVACPSSFHEFERPDPIPYDVEGTDRGNRYKGVLSCLPQQSEPCQSGRIPQWACRLRPLSPTPKEPLAYRATPSFGLLKPPYEVVFDLFCSARKADLSKAEKTVAGYDEDATAAVDLLIGLENCNGRIAATGMCLGGHLAFRAAFDPRVKAAVCFFATDIHGATLGKGGDDSLESVKAGALSGPDKAELVMIFGKQDTHVPRAGRDLIRKTLEDANVACSFLEVQAQHAFIRDESSKGRWDAALTRNLFGFMMEVFERSIGRDIGPREGAGGEVEHVC